MNAVLSHIRKHFLITTEADINIHIQVFFGISVFFCDVTRSGMIGSMISVVITFLFKESVEPRVME